MEFLFKKSKQSRKRVFVNQDKFYSEKVLYDQKFGLEILPFQLKEGVTMSKLYGSDKEFPWRKFLNKKEITIGKKKYNTFVAIHLDVHHFRDWELDVTVDGLYVVVTAVHGPRNDPHGITLRKYERKIKFPDHVIPATVASEISKDGILTISGDVDIQKFKQEQREDAYEQNEGLREYGIIEEQPKAAPKFFNLSLREQISGIDNHFTFAKQALQTTSKMFGKLCFNNPICKKKNNR